jgi:hypothetical protein
MALPLILAGASLLTSAGSALVDHRRQATQAKQTHSAALDSLLIERRDITARGSEERRASARSVDDGARAGTDARSLARASAGESGLGGMSIDFLLADIDRQEADHRTSVLENLSMTLNQLDRLRAGASATAQSRSNSAQPPSALNTALRIGGALLSFGAQRAANKPPEAP